MVNCRLDFQSDPLGSKGMFMLTLTALLTLVAITANVGGFILKYLTYRDSKREREDDKKE